MNLITDVLDRLDGYKTYIVCTLVIVIEVLKYYGILEVAVANSLEVLLGAGGLAALRAGVKK
jgi:hypothetical protein